MRIAEGREPFRCPSVGSSLNLKNENMEIDSTFRMKSAEQCKTRFSVLIQ